MERAQVEGWSSCSIQRETGAVRQSYRETEAVSAGLEGESRGGRGLSAWLG